MVYNDPKESWDNAKERLMEEIEKDGFDSFVDEASVPPLFSNLFNLGAEAEAEAENDEECCGAKWSKVED
jgi:hypothetical protein